MRIPAWLAGALISLALTAFAVMSIRNACPPGSGMCGLVVVFVLPGYFLAPFLHLSGMLAFGMAFLFNALIGAGLGLLVHSVSASVQTRQLSGYYKGALIAFVYFSITVLIDAMITHGGEWFGGTTVFFSFPSGIIAGWLLPHTRTGAWNQLVLTGLLDIFVGALLGVLFLKKKERSVVT